MACLTPIHRAAAVALLALGGCTTTPIYTFNLEPTGHIAGWTVTGIRDDKGTVYTGPGGAPVAGLFFADQHEAPNYFPCTAQTPAQCDTTKGYGSLGVALPQGSVLTGLGFPPSSAYWEVDVMSPVLPPQAAGMNGLAAVVGDLYSVAPAKVSASLFLEVQSGTTTAQVLPTGGPLYTAVSKTGWTSVSMPFAVPAGAVPRRIGVRLRGTWQGTPLYDGAMFLDNVQVLRPAPPP
jgi:hypothetical protein